MSRHLHVALCLILAVACNVSWAGKAPANKPPVVSLTSPTSGATFAPPATIMLSASASDPDGTIAKVDFYRGTSIIGSVTTAPYSLTWSNVSAGTYSLTAKATDNAGAVTTSTAASITVAAPTISITSPANGAVIYGDSVTVNGTFVGDSLTSVWVDNQNSTRLATISGSSFSATVPIFVGPNTINVSVARADKTSESTSFTVNGSGYPLIAFKSPASPAVFDAPANIPLEVDAVSPAGTIASVSFIQGSSTLATLTSPPYQYTLVNAPAGNYNITAQAVDNLGYSASSATTVVVRAANVPPTISLTSPSSNAQFQEPARITLAASASDTDGSISMVEFFQDGALLGSTNISPYSFALTNVAKGSYSYTARATDDRGGATTSAPVSITVTQPNALPTVTLTSPKEGDVYRVETEGSTVAITLEAVASDSDGTIAKVEFFQGATLIGATTTAPYTVSWNNAGPGTHVLTVKVTDNFGATTSATVNVTVTSNETITYLHNDFAGSPLAATDINGAIVWKENYRPYGVRLNKQVASANNHQWFHGKSVDEDTQLSYFGARYYDPTLGRFNATDPVQFQEGNVHSFNRYAYGNNNPYKYLDPDGRLPIFIPLLAIGLAATELATADVPFIGGQPTKAALTAAEQLAVNKATGKIGEAMTRTSLGDGIAGEQITVVTSTGKRTVVDFVTRIGEALGVVETKTGKAKLSAGQKQLAKDIKEGKAVTPVGKNAKNAGLEPGQPIKFDSHKVDHQ